MDSETGQETRYNLAGQNLGQEGIDAAYGEKGKFIRNEVLLDDRTAIATGYDYTSNVKTLVHELQHFRQNHYTLSQGADRRSVDKQHEIMKDAFSSYYSERKSVALELWNKWLPSYLKYKSRYKNENDFIHKLINSK